jgi:hypothetical protein
MLLGHVSIYKLDACVKIPMKVPSGPTIMVMSIFKSSQCQFTLSLYLAKSSSPCTLLYVLLLVKWLVRSKEQLVPAYVPVFPVKRQSSIQRTVCTLLMFCYRSNRKFDPKNSLSLPACCDIDQVASSIQRTACICLLPMFLVK